MVSLTHKPFVFDTLFPRLFVKCKNIEIGNDIYNILNKNKIGYEKYKNLAKNLSKEIISTVNSFVYIFSG